MPVITADALLQLCPTMLPERAAPYAAGLDACLASAEINTPLRIAHFMAQISYESNGFKALIENLAYRNPDQLLKVFKSIVQTPSRARVLVKLGAEDMGNFLYGDNPHLGNTQAGDGFRFIGRGFIMITGRYNYTQAAQRTGLDLLNHPELLEDPKNAALAAAGYWAQKNINAQADLDNIKGVTQLINSALLGLDGRAEKLAIAKRLWPDTSPPPSSAQPGSSQAGSSQPGSSQPGSSQPGSSQPGSSQPSSAQPALPQTSLPSQTPPSAPLSPPEDATPAIVAPTNVVIVRSESTQHLLEAQIRLQQRLECLQ